MVPHDTLYRYFLTLFFIKDAFGRCECKHGRNGDGSCRDRFEGESKRSRGRIISLFPRPGVE